MTPPTPAPRQVADAASDEPGLCYTGAVEADEARIRAVIYEQEQAAWALAALAASLRDDLPPELAARARDVLDHLDLALPADAPTKQLLEAAAKAPLVQTAGFVRFGDGGWAEQDDDALLAQGRMSARGAALFADAVLPRLAGLPERLDGGWMLDVGVGVAAMAVEFCCVFPTLNVVGIDVFAKALRLAEGTVASAGMTARIELREQDVAALGDVERFDLAWLPAPFLPPEALRAGIVRVARSLRSGGWMVVGHGKYGDDAVDNAINRFKTSAWGGTPLDAAEAQQLLGAVGLGDVDTLATPPGAPSMTIGRKP